MSAQAWQTLLEQIHKLVMQAAQVSLQFIDILARRIADGQSKLLLLLRKTDQAILREIAAAFEAFADANATNSVESCERLHTLAETNLYDNTNLDRALTTGDHPNSYWMAQGHYLLALLYALRGDGRMASPHPLRILCADPRQAHAGSFCMV
jgi:hypothetical protein